MKLGSLKIIAAVLISFLVFSGCDDSTDSNNNITIIGSGRIASKTRHIDDCSGLVIKNVGNVFLTQDNTQSIRIEADDNIIDNVISKKENGWLVVGLPDGSYSNITLRIYVSLKTLEKISIEGAGNVECTQPVHSGNLFCSINGAGNIMLKGEGDNLNCLINGAGNIDAKEFITENCTAAVNGAGKCILYAAHKLDASVNGVGTIIYYGNPPEVKTSISGIGQIKQGT